MDLVSNPSQPGLLALDMNDSIKFVRLTAVETSNRVLTRDDCTLTSAELPSLPQPVDSYNVKCMSWCSSDGGDGADTLAVGLSSGKVLLLKPDDHRPQSGSGRFVNFASHSRPCNCLSWSESHPNLLAIGLERARAESSLLIWDMASETGTVQSHGRGAANHTGSSRSKHATAVKPLAEACMAETVNSLTWARHESKVIVAGVASKQLRLVDIRNIRSTTNQVNTKAVSGIARDPCFDMRYASFYDNQVHIWDLRSFAKPAAIISTKYNIVKTEWCPTRNGLLATVSSGSGDGQVIRAYDMTHAVAPDSDTEISYRHIEQLVKPGLAADEYIGTFSWITHRRNNLIAVTNAGTLYNVNVQERISIDWTKGSSVLAASDQMYQCDNLQSESAAEERIEHIMYKRASNGYGLHDVDHSDPQVNLEPENSTLRSLWKWMNIAEHSDPVEEAGQELKSPTAKFRMGISGLFKQQSLTADVVTRYSGLLEELRTQGASSPETINWRGVPSASCTIYTGPHRTRALNMCGWSQIWNLRPQNTALQTALEAQDNIERATALALWHLDMRLATDILQRASASGNGTLDAQHPIIAMALSGYTGKEGSALWREMCTTLQKSLPSPYLRAGFAFLSAQDNGSMKYKELFKIEGIEIRDLVGFACTHLPDGQLLDVLESLSATAAKTGDLGGVVVTGLSTDRGVELLQTYVDKTKDVQTAALALIRTKNAGIFSNKTARHMLSGYRELLNVWALWKERASLDLAVGTAKMGERSKSQLVFVQCNYCGKSVRHDNRLMARSRGALLLHTPGMTSKVSSCPSCRKPLPRCAVCCMYLGTSPTDAQEGTFEERNCDKELGNWFTWCPMCQHGGHADHLAVWFEDHLSCPLSGCKCRCWSAKKESEELAAEAVS